jgi:hypothetical protein
MRTDSRVGARRRVGPSSRVGTDSRMGARGRMRTGSRVGTRWRLSTNSRMNTRGHRRGLRARWRLLRTCVHLRSARRHRRGLRARWHRRGARRHRRMLCTRWHSRHCQPRSRRSLDRVHLRRRSRSRRNGRSLRLLRDGRVRRGPLGSGGWLLRYGRRGSALGHRRARSCMLSGRLRRVLGRGGRWVHPRHRRGARTRSRSRLRCPCHGARSLRRTMRLRGMRRMPWGCCSGDPGCRDRSTGLLRHRRSRGRGMSRLDSRIARSRRGTGLRRRGRVSRSTSRSLWCTCRRLRARRSHGGPGRGLHGRNTRPRRSPRRCGLRSQRGRARPPLRGRLGRELSGLRRQLRGVPRLGRLLRGGPGLGRRVGSLGRACRHRRPAARPERSGNIRLILIVKAQELPGCEPTECLPLRLRCGSRRGGRLRWGPRRRGRCLRRLRVVAQELPGREPPEHSRLLRGDCWRRSTRRRRSPSGLGDGRPTGQPRPGAGPGRLGIQLDVALRAGDAVALLQVGPEPQLRDDARHDAQARGEPQLIHRRHVEGARHRHLQAPPILREREHHVLLGHRRRDQGERRHRDRLELLDRRLRVARLLGEHRPQRLDVQVLQIDQVGPQTPSVDHLGLQGLFELNWVDEALADQERTELFSHEGTDSRRLP